MGLEGIGSDIGARTAQPDNITNTSLVTRCDAPDTMGAMLRLSERAETKAEQLNELPAQSRLPRAFHATPTRRVLLLTALGGLLIAGVITALPFGGDGRLPGYAGSDPLAGSGSRGNAAFGKAKGGVCLDWPDKSPDAATIVDCAGDHRFEVAESIDMRTFPGTEYGPDAAPPSAARIQQISLEQCQPAVRRYLGDKYDPNSKFTISMLWSGDRAWKQSGERRMLCGLQLLGPDNQQVAFKGKVADVDQSKVWSAGTCLGIDTSTNQPTDIPVDCSAPHAMEVTGAVNLAEKFPGPLPSEADQDAFIKDVCTKMTDAYLAPIQLRTTTLTLIYSTVSLPSWTAGSSSVSCSIGATLGNGGWATLLNSAKGPLLVNGQPPIPPPDIPQERLNLPSIPVAPQPTQPATANSPTYSPSQSTSGNGTQSGSQNGSQSNSNQHLPQQQAPGPQAPAPAQPAAPPPPVSDIAPNDAPQDAPPMDAPAGDAVPPPA